MIFTYPQKRKIIEHLSNRANWRNLFDIEFFMDVRRKWRNVESPSGITACVSPDGKQAYVRHNETGATIRIERDEDGFVIEDESERRFHTRADVRDEPCAGLHVVPLRSAEQVEQAGKGESVRLNAFGIIIHMHYTGEKELFVDGAAKHLRFDRPAFESDNKNAAGRFFHSITFNDAAAKEWGVSSVDLLNAVKLVAARDLGMEPELLALNAFDPELTAAVLDYILTPELDETWTGPERWRPRKIKSIGDSSVLRKAWTDSTDFEGYYTGLPRAFSIGRTDDGFELRTMLDQREQVWTQGALVRQAAEGKIEPARLLRPEMTPRSLLHMLRNGAEIKDHRGRAWLATVYESGEAGRAAFIAREIIRRNFDLTGYHGAAVSFNEKACMVAMDATSHEETLQAYDASMALRAMIRDGSEDANRAVELLQLGANLRYIDPKAVLEGRTFANLMSEAANGKLLDGVRAHYGIHEVMFEPPAPL